MKIETVRRDDGLWIAEVPDIPGAQALGRTQREAVASVEVLALHIKGTPVSDRPMMQCARWSRSRFRGKSLVIIVTLLVLIVGNGTLAYAIQGRWESLLMIIFAAGFLLPTHVSLNSGVSSSNWGTYYRDTEPVRFWLDNIISSAAVLFAAYAAWAFK